MLIDNTTGFPAIVWGVIKLNNGKQVTLIDYDLVTQEIMVESLSDSTISVLPLKFTQLRIEK